MPSCGWLLNCRQPADRGKALLPEMLQGQTGHSAHMIINKPIIENRPLAAVCNQLQLPQKTQLMADRGLGNGKKRRQITDTHFTVLQGQNNPEPGSIPQRLEKIGKPVNLTGSKGLAACAINPLFMNDPTLTTICIICHAHSPTSQN
jgi:hypothetical protein